MPKKRRRRRRNPSQAMERYEPNPRRRRGRGRRRRNPSRGNFFGGAMGNIGREVGTAGWRLGGAIFCAAVSHLGKQATYNPVHLPDGGTNTPQFTEMGGDRWAPWTYFAVTAGGWLVSRLLGGMRQEWGTEFGRGVLDVILRKITWGELVSRSFYGMRYLGQGEQTTYDQNGNVWLRQPDGSQAAMMGGYGQLVEARPLDGYGQLVEARPLDGFGHAIADSPAEEKRAQWHGAGFRTPFHYAYQSAY